MKETKAQILLDSNIGKDRITCFIVTYPYIVHPEVLRHRSNSFCSASLRAIPLSRIISQFFGFIPKLWRKHQPGMQPLEGDVFTEKEKEIYLEAYHYLAKKSKDVALSMHKDGEGVAKEQVNRFIAPYLYITHLMQGTERSFEHFFNLRCDTTAQYEVRELAIIMRDLYYSSKAVEREVHLPYAQEYYDNREYNLLECMKISSARSARVSYYNHEGLIPKASEDFNLANNLYENKHLSPFEFPVISFEFLKNNLNIPKYCLQDLIEKESLVHPDEHYGVEVWKNFSGNLNNWRLVQFRKLLEQGITLL
jgi:hypothetical protein